MVEGVQQGPVLVGTFFMVAEAYLPPTAAPGTWALMSPAERPPQVQIVESVESTPNLEARDEGRCSGRRALVGHGLDMEDLASMGERQWRKACNLRSAAEELEETGSNGRARRYWKHGSPKTRSGSQGDGDGSQPGQAVVSCRFRGAFRWLSDRFPFGVGRDGQTAHKGAHGCQTQPGA